MYRFGVDSTILWPINDGPTPAAQQKWLVLIFRYLQFYKSCGREGSDRPKYIFALGSFAPIIKRYFNEHNAYF